MILALSKKKPYQFKECVILQDPEMPSMTDPKTRSMPTRSAFFDGYDHTGAAGF